MIVRNLFLIKTRLQCIKVNNAQGLKIKISRDPRKRALQWQKNEIQKQEINFFSLIPAQIATFPFMLGAFCDLPQM